MKDFWGYERDVKPNGAIASSEFATIVIGGGDTLTLVQSVNATYQQMVQPKFESGSPTLYYLTGHPSGTIEFSRLVGKEGFLASMSGFKDSCGSIIGVTLGLNGTGGCAAASAKGGQSARFSGAVPQSIRISWQAESLECQEGGSMMVASLDSA